MAKRKKRGGLTPEERAAQDERLRELRYWIERGKREQAERARLRALPWWRRRLATLPFRKAA